MKRYTWAGGSFLFEGDCWPSDGTIYRGRGGQQNAATLARLPKPARQAGKTAEPVAAPQAARVEKELAAEPKAAKRRAGAKASEDGAPRRRSSKGSGRSGARASR